MKARRQQKQGPSRGNQLRIIAGKWRGRKLDFPSTAGLRPTGDRIRETLFNWLAPHLPGARCLDAFAGSGALGYEALSRGAAEVVFVENNPAAYRHLEKTRENLDATGARLVLSDLTAWLTPGCPPFDIVFVDPPFDDSLQNRCLEQITALDVLKPGALVYLESPADYRAAIPPELESVREKLAGDVAYRLLRRLD